jgi:chromosome partitioning protein
MHVVSVVGGKGGTGKSTVCENHAVAESRKGRSVCIVDLDPQGTSLHWSERRGNDSPAVVSCQASALAHVLEEAERQGARLAIIDTPGKSTDIAVAAAKVAALVVLPVQPMVADVETLVNARDILTLAGNPRSLVVINRAFAQGRRYIETAEAVAAMGFAVCETVLFQRAAYADAANIGKGAVEYAPGSKAAAETLALHNAITSILEGKPDVKKRARRRA